MERNRIVICIILALLALPSCAPDFPEPCDEPEQTPCPADGWECIAYCEDSPCNFRRDEAAARCRLAESICEDECEGYRCQDECLAVRDDCLDRVSQTHTRCVHVCYEGTP